MGPEEELEATMGQIIKTMAEVKKSGMSKDQFKSAIYENLSSKSKYNLAGKAGFKRMGADLGLIYTTIDNRWEDCDSEPDGDV